MTTEKKMKVKGLEKTSKWTLRTVLSNLQDGTLTGYETHIIVEAIFQAKTAVQYKKDGRWGSD